MADPCWHLCERNDTRAFTCGNAIVFNDGEYDPESAEGQYLLAHELAHVKQQTGGANGVRAAGVASGSEATHETGAAISMMPQGDADLEIDPDPQLEREADQAAEDALSGEEPLVVDRLGTDVHIQRVPENKVFEAMALFEAENESGEISDFREDQNENRLAYLHGVAQDVIEKQQKESELASKQELQNSPSKAAQEVAKRGPSQADIKTQIENLKSDIDVDLSDVALTEDQRELLDGNVEISKWDKASWGLIKKILSATTIPALISLANLGSSAADYDIDKRGSQTIGQFRQGKITSLDDLKDIWRQTNGSLEERAKQIEQEIREGTWLEDQSRGLSHSTQE
ncbi:eCIS core domain-containing protein [Halovivax ruber]|uniref:eCIS core domain-containing protein n=1 Tax=Halovivax ruber TaxID=387341 RepID=UPI000B1E9D36